MLPSSAGRLRRSMSRITPAFTLLSSRLFRRAVVATLLAGALALSASRAAAQAATPTHVACVGDSITAGLFASSPAASYPSVMQNLFGSTVQVGNFGHSGATMMSVADQPYQNQVE